MIDKGYQEKLSDGMILRIANTVQEIERIGIFNELVHEEQLEDYIISLYEEHSSTGHIFWLYLEEKGEIVASLALMYNCWIFAEKAIEVAEMGFVGTHPDYRGRGYFKILNELYEKMALERGWVLSVLRGIPNFYSKRGYTFVLDTDIGYAIEKKDCDFPKNVNIQFIPARLKDDADYMKGEYLKYMSKYFVKTDFDLLSKVIFKENPAPFSFSSYIIKQNNFNTGFITLGPVWDTNHVDIFILTNTDPNIFKTALSFATSFKSTSEIMIIYTHKIPIDDLKVKRRKGWKWQVKILDLYSLLYQLRSTLEKRMKEDITDTLTLSDYKHTIQLNIEKGKIISMKQLTGYPDHTIDVKIPNNLISRLILGENTITELNQFQPDCIFKSNKLELIAILFPKLVSLPHMVY